MLGRQVDKNVFECYTTEMFIFSLFLLFICFLPVVVVVVVWGVQAGVIGVGLMLIMSLLACCAVFTNEHEAFVCKLFYNRNF